MSMRITGITLCCLLCLLSPLVIAVLGNTYGPESERGMEPPWSAYAIDYLWLTAACSTLLLIWLIQKWRWLVALIAVPLLILTSMLAISNDLWVSGDYL